MMAASSTSSLAEQFCQLPLEVRQERIARLTQPEKDALGYVWGFHARPGQLIPQGDWDVWLVMAGRGFGKTRTGAETVRQWVRTSPIVNIIGPTAGDIHKVILDGPAGIMNICPPGERPRFRNKDLTLLWPNGAKSLLFSAEEPERLRGPQAHKLWCDELAAWRYQQEVWDLAMFGLRLGDNPQTIVTTTPKPTKLVRQLRDSARTLLTRGSTYENRSNLAAKFYASIITKYEGTRLGRQELNAELLEDNPGALFHLANIDDNRWEQQLPELSRIVVAIDPSASSNEESDECGIVVCGRDAQRPPHYYVLDDLSQILSPNDWGKKAVQSYRQQKADRIVAEVNNGGDMVEAVIRNVDPNVSYKKVHASRGKVTRAEPVAALYEQNRVHHVGSFPQLEDQMCDYDPQVSVDSPDRMDALVWAVTELSEGTGGMLDFYHSELDKREAKVEEKPAPTQTERQAEILKALSAETKKLRGR